jgi:hypothetical protein
VRDGRRAERRPAAAAPRRERAEPQAERSDARAAAVDEVDPGSRSHQAPHRDLAPGIDESSERAPTPAKTGRGAERERNRRATLHQDAIRRGRSTSASSSEPACRDLVDQLLELQIEIHFPA